MSRSMADSNHACSVIAAVYDTDVKKGMQHCVVLYFTESMQMQPLQRGLTIGVAPGSG